MIKAFNAELKRDYISVCDLSNEASISVSIITAARGSMARTVSALISGNGKRLVRALPAGCLGAIADSDSWEEVSAAAAAANGPPDSRRAFTASTEPVDWSA
jgi:hypothetical protein